MDMEDDDDYSFDAEPMDRLYHCLSQYLSFCDSLLDIGAINLNAKQTEDGKTPLLLACHYRLWEVVELLVKRKGVDLNAQDEYGNTALLIACERKRWDLVDLLLAKNADVHLFNNNGQTALCLACSHRRWDLARTLILEKGANVNLGNSANGFATPLHYAIDFEEDEITKLLIEKNANVKAIDEYGSTPLHNYATVSDGSNDWIIQMLLERGAEINAKDKKGWTPLHVACEEYSTDIDIQLFRQLIAHGADVNSRDNRGRTALHMLALANYNVTRKIQLLIDAGADPNIQDNDGDTPLHVLCCEENATGLVTNGASLQIRNNTNKTPIERLRYFGNALSYLDVVQDFRAELSNNGRLYFGSEYNGNDVGGNGLPLHNSAGTPKKGLFPKVLVGLLNGHSNPTAYPAVAYCSLRHAIPKWESETGCDKNKRRLET